MFADAPTIDSMGKKVWITMAAEKVEILLVVSGLDVDISVEAWIVNIYVIMKEGDMGGVTVDHESTTEDIINPERKVRFRVFMNSGILQGFLGENRVLGGSDGLSLLECSNCGRYWKKRVEIIMQN